MRAAATPIRARDAAAIGVVLFAVALLFGVPSLLVPALALLLVPALAWIWVATATAGLGLRRSVPAGPLLEGEAGRLRIDLERGAVPPPGGEIADPLLEQPLGLWEGFEGIEREVAFDHRGRRRVGSATVRVRDPLGLCERRLSSADAGELIVLPRPAPVRFRAGGEGARALGLGARGGGGGGPDSWAAEFEIDGLRPYRDGSPASRIHWPTVARTGELEERRITAGADAARLLVVDPVAPAAPAALDAAVRAAASLCLELADHGLSVLVPPVSRLVELDASRRHWPELHARLALIGPDDGAPPVHRIGRAGVVLWVSADPGPRPAQQLRRIASSRRVLVRPGLATEGALFSVAGCSGRLLGAASGSRRRGAAVG